MPINNPDLDSILNQWQPEIYRFCLLLSCRTEAAEDIMFQTFLYIGAELPSSRARQSEEETAVHLFRYAFRTCEDYYYRKMRRRPKREQFQESVPFPVSDQLWQVMKLPFKTRAVLLLLACSNFTHEDIVRILPIRPEKVAKLSPGEEELSRLSALLMTIRQNDMAASQLSGRLAMRFQERNVPLENRLRDIRAWIDHIVIWLAGAIILLCAAAVWYTSRL